ncbi:DUF2798 domain-containing protein [Flavobacterium degerlachei]|jgi:hypothetical protein|uniref:DUF2798 domain-containing protein n=1 Tax=Flavobacterium degerlachei TaxID=229203 RepID=A0A1H3BZN7_9FLAO|nr:DUF2798 domain-containing protein [Flavobacterium degerlachei]SDX46854.1 Protein of unknown function [Flavobacterium degerlachei]
MRKTILGSVIVTAFITFTLTALNIPTKNTIDFVMVWTRSWIIAATIASVFNLYILPFFHKNKNSEVQ